MTLLSELVERDGITTTSRRAGTWTTPGPDPVTFPRWRVTLRRDVDGEERTMTTTDCGHYPPDAVRMLGLLTNDARVCENTREIAAESGPVAGIEYMTEEYDMPIKTLDDYVTAMDTYQGISESADGLRAFIGDAEVYREYLAADD